MPSSSTPRDTSQVSLSSSVIIWSLKYWYSIPIKRAMDSTITDTATAMEVRKSFAVMSAPYSFRAVPAERSVLIL